MSRRPLFIVAALAVCLALALGGQAVADSAISRTGDDTGATVGRAASSYLAGLRVYAAAALWNRIDPLLHYYYVNVPIDQQRYLLTTIAMVQALDPHAVRSYSLGAWLLVRNDRVDDGIAMSERGVQENPDSGIALASLAQIQWLYGDKDRALEVAARAMDPEVIWPGPNETYTWFATLRDIFKAEGRTDMAAEADARMLHLEQDHGATTGGSDENGE